MYSRRSSFPRMMLAGFMLAFLAIANFAFAAANVVPEVGLGDGSGTVSGYTISGITWTLVAANPSTVQSVAMNVAPTGGAGAATKVRITVNAGVTWISCTGPVGNTWTCTFGTPPNASAITLLQVVAAQ